MTIIDPKTSLYTMKDNYLKLRNTEFYADAGITKSILPKKTSILKCSRIDHKLSSSPTKSSSGGRMRERHLALNSLWQKQENFVLIGSLPIMKAWVSFRFLTINQNLWRPGVVGVPDPTDAFSTTPGLIPKLYVCLLAHEPMITFDHSGVWATWRFAKSHQLGFSCFN